MCLRYALPQASLAAAACYPASLATYYLLSPSRRPARHPGHAHSYTHLFLTGLVLTIPTDACRPTPDRPSASDENLTSLARSCLIAVGQIARGPCPGRAIPIPLSKYPMDLVAAGRQLRSSRRDYCVPNLLGLGRPWFVWVEDADADAEDWPSQFSLLREAGPPRRGPSHGRAHRPGDPIP